MARDLVRIRRFYYDSIRRTYDCMFKYYEKEFDTELDPAGYYIIRFDGKGMTKRFKGKDRLFDPIFFKSIKEAFLSFCDNHSAQILFGYQCSDEISVFVRSVDPNGETIYNRIEKLLSLLAAEVSVLFDRRYRENLRLLAGDAAEDDTMNVFDARIFKVPRITVPQYFYLRQEYGIEHISKRIKNECGDKDRDNEAILEILRENGLNAEDVYYGVAFARGADAMSFDFGEDVDRLNALIFPHKR